MNVIKMSYTSKTSKTSKGNKMSKMNNMSKTSPTSKTSMKPPPIINPCTSLSLKDTSERHKLNLSGDDKNVLIQ